MHVDQVSPTMWHLRHEPARNAPHEKPLEQTDSAEEYLNQLNPPRTSTCDDAPERDHCLDQEYPELANLPDRQGPPRSETKSQIYRQYRRGDSVEMLAQQFCQSPTAIDRIIHELRAAHIMELQLDHVANEQFTRLISREVEAEILGPLQESDLPTKKPPLPKDLPAYLASLYEVPLLTREQEIHLFRKMNYLLYKASKLRAHADSRQPDSRWMDRIEQLYEESVAIKKQIISANLRLVVSITKRYVGAGEFFELVSDGNVSLMRAVARFDFSRGNRFSTYASWAIIKNFGRSIPLAFRQRSRFCTSSLELFTGVEDVRPNHREQESEQIQRESYVKRLLGRLDERERQIITSRFGLTRGQEPLKLKQVGAAMGVTKERIRQIQYRAMNKLRKAAEEDRIEHDIHGQGSGALVGVAGGVRRRPFFG